MLLQMEDYNILMYMYCLSLNTSHNHRRTKGGLRQNDSATTIPPNWIILGFKCV